MGDCVFQEGPKHEAKADPQVHVDGLYEAVGVGKRSAGPDHQCGHGQYGGHSWENRQAMFPRQWPGNLTWETVSIQDLARWGQDSEMELRSFWRICGLLEWD